MTAKFLNRVKETTDSTGTSTIDLNGAATGFRAFLDEANSGDSVYYLIVDDPANPTAYEYGIGTITAGTPDTLSRDTVEGSSNSGSKVSFLAGTKTVIASPTAAGLGGIGPLAGWALKNPAVAAKTADYTVTAADDGKLITGDASGLSPATLTFSLPAPASGTYPVHVFVNVGASGSVVIASGDSPADTIDGASSLTLSAQYDAAILWWTGTAWLSVARTVAAVYNADDITSGTLSTARMAAGTVIQVVAMSIAAASGTTDIPDDNTTPTSTEGTEAGSQAITLSNAANKVLIQSGFQLQMVSGNRAVAALFRGTTCLATAVVRPGSDGGAPINFNYLDAPGSVGPHTYSVRVGRGTAGGTWYVAQDSSGSKYNGTIANCGVTLTEIVG